MSESIGREYHLVLTSSQYSLLKEILNDVKYEGWTPEAVERADNIRNQLITWNNHLDGIKS